MKRTGKGIALTMGILLLASAAMGGCSSGSGETKEISSVSAGESALEETTSAEEETAETEAAAEATAVSVDEQVLFDANDIKITATGMTDGYTGTELKLLIENNSAQPIMVQARDASVNGYMVDTVMSADVAAGKKAIGAVQFFSTDLEENAITDITDVELHFHVFDASWNTVFDSDVISMTF